MMRIPEASCFLEQRLHLAGNLTDSPGSHPAPVLIPMSVNDDLPVGIQKLCSNQLLSRVICCGTTILETGSAIQGSWDHTFCRRWRIHREADARKRRKPHRNQTGLILIMPDTKHNAERHALPSSDPLAADGLIPQDVLEGKQPVIVWLWFSHDLLRTVQSKRKRIASSGPGTPAAFSLWRARRPTAKGLLIVTFRLHS